MNGDDVRYSRRDVRHAAPPAVATLLPGRPPVGPPEVPSVVCSARCGAPSVRQSGRWCGRSSGEARAVAGMSRHVPSSMRTSSQSANGKCRVIVRTVRNATEQGTFISSPSARRAARVVASAGPCLPVVCVETRYRQCARNAAVCILAKVPMLRWGRGGKSSPS